MTDPKSDKIDELSDRWFTRYPKMKTGPWQIWGRMVRINESFLIEASNSLVPAGLNYKEFQTLAALVLSEEPSYPSQIASFSMLTSGGTANLLSRLESKGLITRKQNTQDKRGIIVELTSAGRNLFQTALDLENKVEHKMLEPLTLGEREQLISLLRKLTSELGL
ncbi:MarR family transcriptional regulator [Parasphingorhabdus sp. JC815]|uniref:MarR family winged helix-turn-helix transcriptional regulator n=1 Tax=Parasphingorhabdus sp. JC815 TaxID=3232140 RepID=UPI003458B7B4